LEVGEARSDLVSDGLFAVAVVFDEESLAGLTVLAPSDAGPHLFAWSGRALLGVDGVEPVAPPPILFERASLDLNDVTAGWDHRAEPDEVEVRDPGAEERSIEGTESSVLPRPMALAEVELHLRLVHAGSVRRRIGPEFAPPVRKMDDHGESREYSVGSMCPAG
jgi:hypothetical protein